MECLSFHYDDRGVNATTPFQHDLMLGARLTLNDVESSEALLGMIIDLDNHERSFNLEASRRLTDRWKLGIEARAVANTSSGSLFYAIRNDDYIQAELAYYF